MAPVVGLVTLYRAVWMVVAYCGGAGLRISAEWFVRSAVRQRLLWRVRSRRVPLLAVDGAGVWSFAQEVGGPWPGC